MLYRLNFGSSLRRNAAYAILATTVGVALALLSAVEYNKMLRHLEDVRIEAEVADLTRDIRSRLDTRLHALQFMAEQGRAGRLNTKEEFELAAAAITNVAHEFLAINWIDADRRITFVWPHQNEAQTLGKVVGQSPSILALINAARSTGQPKSTTLVPLFQGGQGVATYFPVWKGDEFKGYVNGVFRIDGLREVVAPTGSHPSLLPEIEIAESANIESDAAHIRTVISLLDKSFVIVVARPTMPSLYRLANPYSYYGVPGSILGGFLLFIGLQNRTARSRQHSMLSTILTAAPDAIVTIDENYKIVVYNPAAEKMFGWNRAEMLGQPLDRLIPEKVRHKHDAHIGEFETSSAVTRQMNSLRITHGLRADGEEIPIAITLSKARFENRVLMTAVMRDISQTLNLNKQLMQLAEDRSRQAEKAQEANKAKTTFLATMSHELRTPLNAIIGFSEFMQTEALGPLGNAKYREYVDDILKSGRQLLEIINDILDLSKIEAGAYRFNPEMFAVAPVIGAVRDVAVPMLLEKNLDLILECDDKLEAYADKRATRQILVNLISNAIKFTPRGGRILIRAQMGEKKDMVEFRISDTGCGISVENLERIWQPFVQVGDAYRAEVKGTGLGLAISRSFAEGMGGDIRIESQFGVGTTVILRLPASNLLPAVVGEKR